MNSVPNVVQEALHNDYVRLCWFKEEEEEEEEKNIHDITGIPKGVEQRGQLRTVCWISKLGKQHWCGVGSEGQTKADQETASP